MSTRSRIGMVCEDGSVKSIYCHWDGYPSNNGKILLESYKDKAKVEKLINLGDISSLEKEVEPPEGAKHTFDDPIDGVTVAYGRDRGETNVETSVKSEEEFKNGDIEEWGYLFKNGKWYVADGWTEKTRKWDELTQDLIKKFKDNHN